MAISDYFGWGSSSSSSSPSSSTVSSPAASATPTPPQADVSNKHVTALNPKGIKPCCACPETKSARDDCFLKYGHEGSKEGEEGEGWRCRELVEAHRRCMKSLGFQV